MIKRLCCTEGKLTNNTHDTLKSYHESTVCKRELKSFSSAKGNCSKQCWFLIPHKLATFTFSKSSYFLSWQHPSFKALTFSFSTWPGIGNTVLKPLNELIQFDLWWVWTKPLPANTSNKIQYSSIYSYSFWKCGKHLIHYGKVSGHSDFV